MRKNENGVDTVGSGIKNMGGQLGLGDKEGSHAYCVQALYKLI